MFNIFTVLSLVAGQIFYNRSFGERKKSLPLP